MTAVGSTRKRCGFVCFGWYGPVAMGSDNGNEQNNSLRARISSTSEKTTVTDQDKERVTQLQVQWVIFLRSVSLLDGYLK